MILKGSQRAGARKLARHLLNADDNEHVEVHEVRGFLSQQVDHALEEIYAISQGTHCHQYMFSLSLSPPENESVPVEDFESALHEIERKLGLDDQPRVIVFHEKHGRRHAHCVWSRIKTKTMTAINMAHFKNKLHAISRQLYMEHGWHMPPGFQCQKNKNPLNYTLAEWQQAKRKGEDPQEIKAALLECWKQSDSKKAFVKAIEEHGYVLAKGDKRGFVAVDYKGEILSLSRWLDVKSKELKAKLGDVNDLPSVVEAQASIAKCMIAKLEGFTKEIQDRKRKEALPLVQERMEMVKRHRKERKKLDEAQAQRQAQEALERSKRMPRGIKAVWYYVTGKYNVIRKRNELEAAKALERDRKERQEFIDRQLNDRRKLVRRFAQILNENRKDKIDLGNQIRVYAELNQQVIHKYLQNGGIIEPRLPSKLSGGAVYLRENGL